MESDSYSIVSKEILQLLIGEKREYSNYPPDKKYVNLDLSLNWKNIQKTCSFFEENYHLTNEFCVEAVEALRPVFQSIHEFVAENVNREYLECKFKWTNSKMLEIPFDTDYTTVDWSLFLSSLLEHALGDIYYTITNHTPPHLLRDLLATDELQKFLGTFPIFFIKILLGTPNACNLRNLVWHGFLADVPLYYISTLLMIMTTVNSVIEESEFQIKNRPLIANLDETFLLMNINTDQFEIEHFRNIVSHNKFILPSHKKLWSKSLEYFNRKQFGLSMMLLLPQLELLLRRIYGDLNDVDITATMNQYYIILDTTMETKINGKSNEIYKLFDQSLLKAIYDVFLALKGPRIRDKIGHGEINFDSVTPKMCLIVFMISNDIMNQAMLNNIQYLGGYETKFNTNGILKMQICTTADNLKLLTQINPPKELRLDFVRLPYTLRDFCGVDVLKIFERPQYEHEIIWKLTQILENINMASINLSNGINAQLCFFKEKKLRSRQRITLVKILESLPIITGGLNQVFNAIAQIFIRCQRDEAWYLFDNVNELLRELKLLLKCAENIKSCTKSSSNEWIRCVKYSQDAMRTIEESTILQL